MKLGKTCSVAFGFFSDQKKEADFFVGEVSLCLGVGYYAVH